MKKMSLVLKELIAGIVIFGITAQIAGSWFVSDKFLFSTGLWLGIVLSVFMAIHMNYTISKALDLGESDARNALSKGYGFRTAVVILAAIAIHFLKLGNIIAVIIGVMGLKAAAYMQPLLDKLVKRREEGMHSQENGQLHQD